MIICFDIDGTLSDRDSRPVKEAVELVKMLCASGHAKVVVWSSNGLEYAERRAAELGLSGIAHCRAKDSKVWVPGITGAQEPDIVFDGQSTSLGRLQFISGAASTPVSRPQLMDERQYARYDEKRAAGVSTTRRDGSSISRERDVQATAAERFAVQAFDQPFREHVAIGGDHEPNMRLGGRSVDVKWLGVDKNGMARMSGNLIINPYDKMSDIYVVVAGTTDTGFELLGWATSDDVKSEATLRDFGYGEKYALPISRLREIATLADRAREWQQAGSSTGVSGDGTRLSLLW